MKKSEFAIGFGITDAYNVFTIGGVDTLAHLKVSSRPVLRRILRRVRSSFSHWEMVVKNSSVC